MSDAALAAPAATNGHTEVSSSLLDRLRAQHAALGKQRTIDIPIPDYPGLVGRFEAVNQDVILEINARRERDEPQIGEYQALLNLSADVLIQTCIGIFERDDAGELVPLNTLLEEWGDEPIVFDERLAEAVGAKLPENPGERTARSVVFAIFRVYEAKGNDGPLGGLSNRIMRWVSSARNSVDEDF